MDVIKIQGDMAAARQSLPPGIIVAIAIAGFAILFSTLTAVGIVVARKRNFNVGQRASEVEGGDTTVEPKTAPLPRLPELSFAFPRQDSSGPSIPFDNGTGWNDWTGQSPPALPLPRRNSKRLSTSRGSFSMRGSWPTVSNIPLSLMPPQSSDIQLNNVAAPGYEIFTDPKSLKRTISRRTTVSVPRDSSTGKPNFNDPYSPTRKRPRKNAHVRSASENQLSTILRSTSERLKTANRQSLTRRLTSLDRVPGGPPLQPLPILPKGKPSESSEQLIESDHEGTVASSIYNLLQSPNLSPTKSLHNRRPKSGESPAPSEDSFHVAPAPATALSSPSRNLARSDQRNTMDISSIERRDLSALINRDSNKAPWERGTYLNLKRSLSFSATYRISLSGDPFFTEVKTSKPIILDDQILGPRPLFIRKKNVGEDLLPPRPQSCIAPLQHVSGNAQKSPRPVPPPHLTPVSGSQELNPFRWSTEQARKPRSTSTSPTRKRGHKGSRNIRTSQLPRSTSVEVVPEEREDETSVYGVHNSLTLNLQLRLSAVDLSQRPLSTTGSSGIRPPSSANFDPSLNDVTKVLTDDSSTVGRSDIPRMNSPMFGAGSNHSLQSFLQLEDDPFARGSPSSIYQKSPAGEIDADSRKLSAENLFPTFPPQGQLVPFTSPDLTESPQPRRPQTASPRRLPHISTIYSASFQPSVCIPQSKTNNLSSPHPPLLGLSNHPNGPRAQPAQSKWTPTSEEIAKERPVSPSVQSSIAMLRRMDSNNTAASPRSTATSPEMDANSKAVRAESLSRRAESQPESKSKSSPSFLLPGCATKAGARPRRGTVVDGQPDIGHSTSKSKTEEDTSEDIDQFLRKRGLVPTSETSKLTPVKERVRFVEDNPSQAKGKSVKDVETIQNTDGGLLKVHSHQTPTGSKTLSTAKETPSMASMMGIGTMNDQLLTVEFQQVDPSSFSLHSSDSETEYEITPNFKGGSTFQIRNQNNNSNSDPESRPPNVLKQARSEEETDILAQYNHSPSHTPPPLPPPPRFPLIKQLPLPPIAPIPPPRSSLRKSTSQPKIQVQIQHPSPRSFTSPSWVWSLAGLGLRSSSSTNPTNTDKDDIPRSKFSDAVRRTIKRERAVGNPDVSDAKGKQVVEEETEIWDADCGRDDREEVERPRSRFLAGSPVRTGKGVLQGGFF